VRARVALQRDAVHRSFPGLSDAGATGRCSAGVTDDAAAACVDEIDGLDRLIGRAGLARRLPRGEHRHRAVIGARTREQRFEAGARRRNDRSVLFAELVADPIHVQMVDAQQPPEDLLDGEVEAEERAARESAPAIAVAMDGQFRMASQSFDSSDSHPVQADHHA
jgi:hypothetical protein